MNRSIAPPSPVAPPPEWHWPVYVTLPCAGSPVARAYPRWYQSRAPADRRATADPATPSAESATKDKTIGKPIAAPDLGDRYGRPRFSWTDVPHLDDLRVPNLQLPRRLHVLRQRRDRSEPRFHPPFFDLANHERVDRDRILAGQDRGVMHREIRMRFRSSGVLRYKPIHDVEHNLRPDELGAINLRDGANAIR